MSLVQKLNTFVMRCGAPAKFVAKTIIGFAVPGSGPVMELIDQLLDCAHETARDNLESLASKEDLQRIEKMFDVLLGDMQDVVEHLKHLEQVPEFARKTLYATLSTEQHCLAAAEVLEEQGLQLSAVQTQLKQVTAGQKELADLQRRQNGTLLEYLKEQKQHNVSPSQMNERLKKIEEAIFAMRHGNADTAEKILVPMSAAQPDSAVLTIAVAASQAAGHSFVRAAKTLERAATLRPRDVKLVEMSKYASRTYSQADTAEEQTVPRKKAPKAGDMLGGWTLEKLLGFGGWGQVFLARKDGQPRAIKIMHEELSYDPEFVKRFKKEIIILAGLGQHPNLVAIDEEHLFDNLDREWNCWYYVMDYVDGANLDDFLKGRPDKPLTLAEARTVFTGVAEGLAQAHQRGIVHRDIKPGNILLRLKPQHGQARSVLADFGLGGQVDPHDRRSGYTVLFAAPEQMQQRISNFRSDVYSLAAAIHYCLLHDDEEKRCCFDADLLPEDFPANLRDLLQRCFNRNPSKRPQDASAFLAEWRELPVAKVAPPAPRKAGDIITNTLGMKFAWIPPAPGGFMMGSPPNEKERSDDEKQHRVILTKGFYLGIHQVTQAQWQAVMGNNPSNFKGDQLPVDTVSWHNAIDFCNNLSKKDGKKPYYKKDGDNVTILGGNGFRLPTEAEWEYACRAGTTTPFHFGETISTKQANYDGNYVYGNGSKGEYRQQTTPVGSFPANAWGLYDMHGNVLEWCNDRYGEYPAAEVTDPQGANTVNNLVLRGGSWYGSPGILRSACRSSYDAGYLVNFVGFRVACCLD